MSDEPKQPPLRLKPRLRPESEAAESSSAEDKPNAVPETPSESSVETKPKLRLKPRLAVEPESEPKKESVAPASSVPAPEETALAAFPEVSKKKEDGDAKSKFRLKPRLSAKPEETAAKEEKKAEVPTPVPTIATPAKSEAPAESATAAPKFTLKKKAPLPESSADADPASEGSSAPPKVDGKSSGKTDKAQSSAMPPPPLVHLKASDDLDDDEMLLGDEEPEASQTKKGSKALLGIVVLIVIGVAGYFAWQQFGPGASEEVASKASPAPAALPKKPATSLPGQLIEKAQSALDARRQGEQNRVDAAVDGKPIPDSQFKRIRQAPDPEPEPVPEQVTTQSQSTIAPGVKATTTTVMSAIEASPEFRSFVGQVRINGVFQGSPARALLNGHTYREGQLVDAGLGIYFDHIVSEEKLIVFRDSNGAIVQRKY